MDSGTAPWAATPSPARRACVPWARAVVAAPRSTSVEVRMVSGWEERKSKGRRVPLQRFRARRAARRSSSQLGRGELFRPAPFTSTAVIVELAGVQDHYAVLGLSPLAPLQLIRQAYLQQIRVAHPDRAAQGAGVRAGAVAQSTTADELNWAWEVLGDEQRRAAYDEERRRSKGASPRSLVDYMRKGLPLTSCITLQPHTWPLPLYPPSPSP